MNIHEEIKQKLAEGAIVYSFALGRVGQIIKIDEHPLFPVVVQNRNWKREKTAATTFLAGDPVTIVEKQDANGNKIWGVVNK